MALQRSDTFDEFDEILEEAMQYASEEVEEDDLFPHEFYGLKVSRTFDSSRGKLEAYSFESIKEATQNFNERLILGQGGFGKVYKGFLPYQDAWQEVAVKVMDFVEGVDQSCSFDTEIRILEGVSHPHVVKLLGFCSEPHKVLVYEFVEMGSLENILAKSKRASGSGDAVSWITRVRIAYEAALALEYLHSIEPEPILHRDFKPGNILLDKHCKVKLADVGLSRIAPELAQSGTGAVSYIQDTTIMGSLGYIDPMYLSSGKFRPASDVYSFGITLLQLVTGASRPQSINVSTLRVTAVMRRRFV
eukprot:gene3915-4878_t